MSGQLFTHSRWHASAASLDSLMHLGVRLVTEEPLKGIVLPSVAFGEEVVSEVTAEEGALVRALHDLTKEVEQLDRRLQGDIMKKMGDAIANSDASQGPFVAVERSALLPSLSDPETADYWSKRQTLTYLHAMLHWGLGERLGLHGWRLGIRSGGKVVKTAPRQFGQ